MWHFCYRPYYNHFHENLVKIGHNRWDTVAFVICDLDLHFQMIRHFCCWWRCHHCGRNSVKIGQMIAELGTKLWKISLLCHCHPSQFCLIFHYFSKTWRRNAGNTARDIRWFHFFHATQFPLEKGSQSCAAIPVASHLLESSSTSIIICKEFLKIFSNLRVTLFVFHTIWRRRKMYKIFQNKDGYWPLVDQWLVIGRCRIRIPYELFNYLISSARLTLNVCFINIRASKMIFCKFWPRPTFAKSSVSRIRLQDAVLLETCWKSVERCDRYPVAFSGFSMWQISHPEIENLPSSFAYNFLRSSTYNLSSSSTYNFSSSSTYNFPSSSAYNFPSSSAYNFPSWSACNLPSWSAYNLLSWSAYNFPSWSAYNLPSWSAYNFPSWVAYNFPSWAAYNFLSWVAYNFQS